MTHMVHEKVKIVGLVKEKGFLYYLDSEGDISRAKMGRGHRAAPPEQSP